MTTHTPSHFADSLSPMLALLDQFPAGCDPEFDDGNEELERQFAEFRMTYDRN